MTEARVPEAEDPPPPVVEATEPASAIVAPTSRSRAPWIAALFAVAGVSFAIAWLDPMGWRVDRAVPALESRLAELSQQVEEAKAQNAVLQGRIAALEAAAPDLVARLDGLMAQVDATDAALTALNSAPGGEDGKIPAASLAALQASVAALQAEVATRSEGTVSEASVAAAVDKAMADWAASEAARLKAETEAAQAQARRESAVEIIVAAAESGVPYSEALSALEGSDLPAVLRDHAETGLPTLQGLVAAFPDAARKALDASLRETGATGLADGLLAFLRVQTGARSLEPREGTDPDAILSRAEALVKAGDVARALDELAVLPAGGQAAIADWSSTAQVYLAAQAALSALPEQLAKQ